MVESVIIPVNTVWSFITIQWVESMTEVIIVDFFLIPQTIFYPIDAVMYIPFIVNVRNIPGLVVSPTVECGVEFGVIWCVVEVSYTYEAFEVSNFISFSFGVSRYTFVGRRCGLTNLYYISLIYNRKPLWQGCIETHYHSHYLQQKIMVKDYNQECRVSINKVWQITSEQHYRASHLSQTQCQQPSVIL